ncbi:MAG: NapC/NirT family cytochrome c [Planctomycetota bacterium]
MKLGGYWPHRMDRVAAVAGGALVIFMLLLSVASVGTYAMVHHTARSEFCNSCHIMEPYYSSWQKSSHHDVPCIDCHYEPGSLETIEGKFKALSQLAKYVTRTAGTKPWAEVSDQSCMRSGCHSLRMLEGEVQFGRVKFNHRQHLLESRRGRRLRCTSCHSQIVQGQHIAVTPSVCFTCHFMPGSDGRRPPETSDCLICHGPPKQAIELAGKSFVHQDYVERGVRCTECHNPVISGNGSVGRDRCHSCHGEVGHIERIGETAFMHEKHVTEHKVECFECHDEIRHGLLPLPSSAVARDQGCGTCHVDPHDAARQVYAGRGAIGVAESPSRMFVARVVCDACHTGRAGFAATPHAAHVEGDVAASHQGVSRVARAAEADCIHCHGPRFAGMLGEWRQGIGQQIDRLRPLLGSLGKQVAAASSGAAQKLYQEAWHDFELVDLDGSRGVHNPAYALATLRVRRARRCRKRAARWACDHRRDRRHRRAGRRRLQQLPRGARAACRGGERQAVLAPGARDPRRACVRRLPPQRTARPAGTRPAHVRAQQVRQLSSPGRQRARRGLRRVSPRARGDAARHDRWPGGSEAGADGQDGVHRVSR